MIVLARLAWLLALSPTAFPDATAGVIVDAPNRVEVCMLATGDCRSTSAALLDPTAAATAGQLAFVDPASGALVAPTQQQLAEVAGDLEITESRRMVAAPARVTRRADGTVVAAPPGGFRVELQAVVTAEPKAAGEGR